MPRHKNTTQHGNHFRDGIYSLISLTPGCTNVRVECEIGAQFVDIYYEEHSTARTLRVACECKNYAKPLTKALVARNIYPRYFPLLERRLVDVVRIIAPHDVGASARKYIEEDCGFSFHTLAQVESNVIDFRQYLRSLIDAFDEDGLKQYYIRPRLHEGADLEETIDSWILGSSSQPVAILGGYGLGKTSFARAVAYSLASRAASDPTTRIPILISLSEISSEQTLEGLLGKLLAAQNRIPGYHFSLFSELNRRGRFVIILDGFDEMKHAISWADFSYNFEQLNRLSGESARVILLGRPSALLNEDEENFLLKGLRRSGDRLYTIAGAPKYITYMMAQVEADEALRFLRRYTNYRAKVSHGSRGESFSPRELDARIKAIPEDSRMLELIRRPIQAKMMADLAIDPKVEWRSFSRYSLYTEFMRSITKREIDKKSRRGLGEDRRHHFIVRVAWWVWQQGASLGFHLDDLPETVFGMSRIDDRMKRELLAGSILEKKLGGYYYFSHRSFVEYLVSEYICVQPWARQEARTICASLTPEIVDFIKESPHAVRISKWWGRVELYPPMQSSSLLAVLAWALNQVRENMFRSEGRHETARDAVVAYYRLVELNMLPGAVADHLLSAFTDTQSQKAKVACLLMALVAMAKANLNERRVIQRKVAFLVIEQCRASLQGFLQKPVKQFSSRGTDDLFVKMFVYAFRGVRGEGRRCIAVAARFDLLVSLLYGYLDIIIAEEIPLLTAAELDEVSRWESFRCRELSTAMGVDDSNWGGYVEEFFTRYPEKSELIVSIALAVQEDRVGLSSQQTRWVAGTELDIRIES